MVNFRIEDSAGLPPPPAWRNKWSDLRKAFASLTPGKCIYVPFESGQNPGALQTAVRNALRRKPGVVYKGHPGERIVTRRDSAGIRIWKVDHEAAR